MNITAGKKLIIFEKVWITETREEVYIAELICQVSKVYDYPRQMRGNPIKSAITVGKYEEFLFIQPSIDPFY